MKLISLAAVLALTSIASADSKSWSTVKGVLPDNVNAVVGANVSALRGTSLYQSIVPMLIAKEPDAKKAIELAKSTCSIDLHAAVVDATFATTDDNRGVLVLALDKSIDQKRALECATKLVAARADAKVDAKPAAPATGGLKAGAKGKPSAAAPPAPPAAAKPPAPKLVTKATGNVTEYGIDGEDKRIYVAWLTADVIAVATDPDDKALLDKMVGGKGAKGAITKFLAKASSNSSIWLATTKSQPIQTGGTMKGAFGTIDATKGNVNVDMNVVMSSPKEAAGVVTQMTELMTSLKGGVPAPFQKLIDAVKLSSAADTTNVKLSAPEKDIMAVVSIAMMNL